MEDFPDAALTTGLEDAEILSYSAFYPWRFYRLKGNKNATMNMTVGFEPEMYCHAIKVKVRNMHDGFYLAAKLSSKPVSL